MAATAGSGAGSGADVSTTTSTTTTESGSTTTITVTSLTSTFTGSGEDPESGNPETTPDNNTATAPNNTLGGHTNQTQQQITRRRVKLYMLNEERLWDDRGTGHVSCGYIQKLQGVCLVVRGETDGSILLESKIHQDTAYQKQQETLIVWSEADSYDLALSFQEKAGCDEIWGRICQIQGKDPSVDITQDVVEESEDERFEEVPDATPPIELPVCELSMLEDISELFSSVLSFPFRREKLAVAIESENYIKRLLELFHMCEDLENTEGLHHLYKIFKSIFLLNKNALFEIMFTDELIFDVIGVLEYDPDLAQAAKHREYLRTKSSFKEVLPLNTELVQKIHQTYRVQYIQDMILPTPSVFEENMLSTLSSFIFFNKIEIVSLLQDDRKFLLTLFSELVDDETDDSRRRDLVLFLKEFCTFSQTLQVQSRDAFFKTLSNMGILGAIEIILGLDDEPMKAAAIDIFSYIVEFSPSMVRGYIVQEGQKQDDDELLINLVIDRMISDADPELGGAVQLMGILRLLIDPENMLAAASKGEKTEFLGFFYKHSMHVLTAPLFANTTEDKPSKDDYQTAQLLSSILELLTFCIEHHTYHVKNYVLNKDLVKRVLILLRSRHAFLALSALRLMRRAIGLKDDFYNRYIIKGDLFKPVVEAFLHNGTKYNLLNSAMIELFEYVRLEDIKSLITYIVENHYMSLEHVDYVQTFKNLKTRYDQHQSRMERPLDGATPVLRGNRYRRDARCLEDEEEMWFEQEEELEDPDTIYPMGNMLKNKLESEFDQINKILESRRTRDIDMKESSPKLNNRTGTISINLSKSPPPNTVAPLSSPISSPVNSPSKTPFSSPVDDEQLSGVQTRKPGLIGLVDYPDEDSDEEEEEDDSVPVKKRPRLSS